MDTRIHSTAAATAETRMRQDREKLYPDNPVLVRIWRGREVESQHRGAWVVCDSDGTVIEGLGSWRVPVFARSTVKCIQALPLLETGAAQRFGLGPAEIALALASHNAEPIHTRGVKAVLDKLGLGVECLLCGPQPAGDAETRQQMRQNGEAPTALHNNCSGKHAGFLALALHLGAPPASYLDPEGPVQRLVRRAMLDMTGLQDQEMYTAVDGCSAPTFRMPLSALATAFARVTNPRRLPALRRSACESMLDAVAKHPEMIAGNHQRVCTDIVRASAGRVFPKVGGEAVYAFGVRGRDRAVAVKIDDGDARGLHPVLIGLLRRFDFATKEELARLESWEERSIRNWAGREVGRTEIAF